MTLIIRLKNFQEKLISTKSKSSDNTQQRTVSSNFHEKIEYCAQKNSELEKFQEFEARSQEFG